jgi:hypothetical protein
MEYFRRARSSASSSTITGRTSTPRRGRGSIAVPASCSTTRPTSCPWLNAVEGFQQNEPKPFTWTADPDKIIAAVKRGHQVVDSLH